MYDERTFEEKLHAAKAIAKVEELRSRHAYTHAVCYEREEYDVYWNRSEHSTFAHGFGRMCGHKEHSFNAITHSDKMSVLGMFNTIKRVPEYDGHDLRSTGHTAMHAIASSVIEVSEDGKFARCFMITPGSLMGAVGFDCKHRGGDFLWERYGGDFAYVDGEWQWFHEQVCPDIMSVYDKGNWAYDSFMAYWNNGREPVGMAPPPPDPDMEFHPSFSPAYMTEPEPIHANQSVTQLVQDTVPPPAPFKTLDDRNTYSPGRNNPRATSNERVPD